MRLSPHQIADILSGESADEATAAHKRNQLRNLQRNGVLQPGRSQDDGAGPLRFPPIEVYRAAIFVALGDLEASAAGLAAIISGAESRSGLEVPPREAGTDAGPFVWRGLASIAEAVAAGERWELRIHLGADDLPYARFVNLDWAEDPVVTAFGPKPRARITVDLPALWAGLPSLEG